MRPCVSQGEIWPLQETNGSFAPYFPLFGIHTEAEATGFHPNSQTDSFMLCYSLCVPENPPLIQRRKCFGLSATFLALAFALLFCQASTSLVYTSAFLLAQLQIQLLSSQLQALLSSFLFPSTTCTPSVCSDLGLRTADCASFNFTRLNVDACGFREQGRSNTSHKGTTNPKQVHLGMPRNLTKGYPG